MKELKAHRLTREINELRNDLVKHQNKCKHAKVTKIYKSNTGNYDYNSDSYWIEFNCPTCLLKWSKNNSK